MKEILYIQAGQLSNYTGTHFWNTQESYFTYSDTEEPLTNNDVSFREGIGPTGEPILCPRLLVFDRKANFGTLAESNALGELSDVEDENGGESLPGPWTGGVVEYRQSRIAKSVYQNRMEESEEKNEDLSLDGEQFGGVRYWSDFNRVYYVPRSIQKLSNVAEWEKPDGDWGAGLDSFKRYDEDKDLMEGDVRWFVEECDSLQGAQTINDTDSFGGFMSGFLTAFRDDFHKLPLLNFPILSGTISGQIDVDDVLSLKKVINDALYLRTLNELSSISVPIQPAGLWSSQGWADSVAPHPNELYRQSSFLSSHIETSTLPLRLKGTTEDLSSISAKLNWRGTTPFVNLGGVFPVSGVDTGLSRQFVNLSIPGPFKVSPQYSRLDVTRGFTPSWIANYQNSAGALWSLNDPYILRFHAPSYPIPTSFPICADTSGRPNGVNMLASLAVSSDTGQLFNDHATFVDDCVRRRRSNLGVDSDELKELANDLWTLYDNYSEGREDAMYED